MKKIWNLGKKEFLTNMKSIRMLIIIFILAVIVIASAYGFSMGQSREKDTPDLVFTHPLDLDDDGWEDDLVVYVTDYWGKPKSDEPVILNEGSPEAEVKKTNDNGRVVFKDTRKYVINSTDENGFYEFFLDIELPNSEGLSDVKGNTDIAGIGTRRNIKENKTHFNDIIDTKRFVGVSRDLERKGSFNDLIYHGITPDGSASKNAELIVNGTKKAEADDAGFIEHEFSPGLRNITIKDEYGNVTRKRNFREERRAPLYGGPDDILIEITYMMIFVVPFMTIALAYDSISKERESNSLFLLITRPIQKWKILTGKLFGNFVSLAIPSTIINLVGVLWIWNLSGISPSLKLTSIFLLSSLGTILVYLSLQMLVSTVSNSSGTAVLGGAGIWLFFNLFYFMIIHTIPSLLGIDEGSFLYTKTENLLGLFNPNLVFRNTIEIIYQEYNYQYLTGVPNYGIFLALILWVIVPAIILTYVFQKTITK